MSESEKIDFAFIKEALDIMARQKYSDDFWAKHGQSIKKQNERMRAEERSLRPSVEQLNRPFDL
jgi:hypothetical protein